MLEEHKKHIISEEYLFDEDEAWELIQERPEQFYVYVLVNPLNNLPFYVGKGQGVRCFRHWNEYRIKGRDSNRHYVNFMRKLYRKTKNIKYCFWAFTNDEQSSYDIETSLIGSFELRKRGSRDGVLYNLHMGNGRNSFSIKTKDFITRAKEVHGDKYDYSETVYKGRRCYIDIICPTHGKFQTTPPLHLAGHDCRECSHIARGDLYRHSKEQVVSRFLEVHKGIYSYDNVNYIQDHVYVSVTCKLHGDFLITPSKHKAGQGCRACQYEHKAWWNTERVRLIKKGIIPDKEKGKIKWLKKKKLL